ncbi:MAG: hypothetical protein Q8P50_14710 [Bacillota bacterium]|nr:hypothetical protein [Bacillota bacterium]
MAMYIWLDLHEIHRGEGQRIVRNLFVRTVYAQQPSWRKALATQQSTGGSPFPAPRLPATAPVQEATGHRSLQTTSVYASLARELMDQQLDPLRDTAPNGGAVELQAHSGIEVDSQRVPVAFTH